MKTKKQIYFISVMLVLSCGLLADAFADESTDQESQLTVPWQEFKKLLHLDENEIVIPQETFQKLLAQTGLKTIPQHTVKEGNVILTRAEFTKLVDRMKPPVGADTKPPFDYLITKAIYFGKMGKQNTTFTGTFTVHVLKKEVFLKTPLLPQSIALEDVKVNGEQALVVTESGYHKVVLSKSGEHIVETAFSLKSSLEKGPHKIDLAIQQTPITLLKLEMPLKDIEVDIPQAQQVLTSVSGGTTVVSAVIAPGRSISVRWRKKVAAAEKIPPKLYSEVYHLISIEDDALKINSDIIYNILHSEVDNVRLSIPEDMNVLSIHGEGVGEWQEIVQNDQRLIHIPFTYGKKGAVTVRIAAEKPLSDEANVTAFSGIQVLDTERETGFIGIELKTSAEVKITESQGLEKVAVQKLPQALYNKSVKPLMYGFKYLKHPFSLVLDIKKHEKIAVPIATINSGSVVTLFTEDGKVVHRLVYQVRNSAKQFLEIQLPEKADVWSVFVGNEPVESSINGEGKLLVPLIRSLSVDNRLDTFPVELIYCLVEKRFLPFSVRKASLPAVDILTSQIIWSVYLPNDYAYLYFKSTLEKEEMIRGLNVFSGPQRQYDEKAMKEVSELDSNEQGYLVGDKLKKAYRGKDYQSKFRNVPLQEEQLTSQVAAELEFSGRLEGLAQQALPPAGPSGGGTSTGVLPIHIQVPTGGQVYRFAKTIITTEDPLTMTVIYAQYWLVSTVKWLVWALLVLILYLKRKTLSRILLWLKDGLKNLKNLYIKYEKNINKVTRSKITPFVLFGILMAFWSASRLFTLLVFLLFASSVIYQFSLLLKKKGKTKSKPPKKAEENSADN